MVLTAIDLNDDMSLKTDKIQDVIFEGHLPAEFETDEAPVPQQSLDRSFGIRLLATHRACVLTGFSHHRLVM